MALADQYQDTITALENAARIQARTTSDAQEHAARAARSARNEFHVYRNIARALEFARIAKDAAEEPLPHVV